MSADATAIPPRLGDLTRRRLLSVIAGLATPVVLAQLSQTLMGLVDTIMVGRLGETALAAVGVATLLFSATAMSLKAVEVAVQTYTARRVGEGRDGEVGAVLATGLVAVFALGTVFMIIGLVWPDRLMGWVAADRPMLELGTDYVRWRYAGMLPLLTFFLVKAMFDGVGWTRVGMWIGIGMNVLNAVLNWALIFGKFGAPVLGVKGAALASTLSAAAAALAVVVWAMRPSIRKRFRVLCRSNFQPRLFAPFLKIAWPPAVQTLANLVAVLILFWILGRISVIAVAAGNIVLRIAALSFMPGFGVGAAVQTLVGQSLGRRDVRGALRASWGGVGLATVFMGIFGVAFLVMPGVFLRVFTDSPDLVAAGTPIMRLMGWVQIADAVGLTLAGALRGAGWTRQVMLADLITGFGLMPVLAYLFGVVLGGGLFGAWGALVLWFTLYAVIMVVLFVRGRWWKNRL
ncbi:MAG: MATE family efflux transporter [bacterium]|nr:MATE family efflux transporter [bacterium]